MATSAKPAQLQPANSLPERVIQQIQASAAGMDKAAAVIRKNQEKQAAIKALIPQVVDTMVKNERIFPNQREKLAETLQDPVKVMELLIKVAGHRNNDELARLGQGIGNNGQVKTAAAANSLTSPHIGRRATGEKESDRRLLSGLGITRQ